MWKQKLLMHLHLAWRLIWSSKTHRKENPRNGYVHWWILADIFRVTTSVSCNKSEHCKPCCETGITFTQSQTQALQKEKERGQCLWWNTKCFLPTMSSKRLLIFPWFLLFISVYHVIIFEIKSSSRMCPIWKTPSMIFATFFESKLFKKNFKDSFSLISGFERHFWNTEIV